jgi:uncharacterized protein YeaO (DUF488 family)
VLDAVAPAAYQRASDSAGELGVVRHAYSEHFGTAKRAARRVVIRLKRAYEPAADDDGARFLVERLWPRGVRKSSLKLDGWLKDVAPSTGLRKWFGHDSAKWAEFRRRYFAELKTHDVTVRLLLRAARKGRVTLVFSSHDAEHNNAVALRDYLEKRRH